jgi:hypothetical protein
VAVVTLLRVLAGIVAGLCLALAGAWLAADLYAPRFLDARLADMGLASTINVGGVNLPRPDVARAHDVDLRDPLSGEVVAHVDDVEFRYTLPGVGGWSGVHPASIAGRGGRVRFSRDADDLGFVRAIEHAIDTVQTWAAEQAEAAGPAAEGGAEGGGPSAPPELPSIDFREIEVVLQMPGLPLDTLPGCDVSVYLKGADTHVEIHTGPPGGIVLLVFGHQGLKQIRVLDVPVAPSFALFLPEGGELLARELRPSGVLQFDLERDADGRLHAEGHLDQATLRPPRVPFPLERSSLPFEIDGNRFSLKEARLRFDGGEVLTSVDHEPGRLVLTLDVVDARFRADFLDLFPQGHSLSWLRCEDGGNIELHLRIEQSQPVDEAVAGLPPVQPLEGALARQLQGGGEMTVRGWGGVLLHRVWIGPTPESQVAVDEVVGSFELRDGELVMRETTGLFADGVLRLRGRLDQATGDIEFNGSVFDADLARIRRAFGGDDSSKGVTGWLEGSVVYTGRIGEPSAAHGQGQLSVRGGNLWNIKIFDAIVRALSLKKPGASESHRLEVQFDIEGDKLDINDLRLDSEFLSLYGSGRVRHLRDVDIDITPITVPLGPLGQLIEYVEAQLIKVEVTGTVTEPKVEVIPIKVVTRPVGAFWGWLTGLFSSDPAPDEEPAPTPAPP